MVLYVKVIDPRLVYTIRMGDGQIKRIVATSEKQALEIASGSR